MSIETFRDLIIGIAGVVLILAFIFFAVLAFMLFRRVKALLDSANATVLTVRELCTLVGENVVKPLAQVMAFVQGIRIGIDTLLNFIRRKEAKKDGE